MSETNSSGNVPAPYEEPRGSVAPGYYYPDFSVGSEEGADWTHTAKLLWQKKWWVLATLAIGTAAGYIGSQFAHPVYQAKTTVWVEQTNRKGGAIRADEVLAGAGWAQIFRSYAVMVPVAREERLYLRVLEPKDPDLSLFANFELLGEVESSLYEFETDGAGRWTLTRPGEGPVERGRTGEAVGLTAGFRWEPPAGAVKPGSTVRFRVMTPRNSALGVWSRLNIKYDGKASLITATLDWNNAEEAAHILNALANQFVRVATDLKSRKIREEVGILEEQSKFVSDKLESALLALESQKIRTITLPTENNAVPATGGVGTRDPVFDSYFNKRLAASQLENDLQEIDKILAAVGSGEAPNVTSLRLIPSLTNAPELSRAVEELRNKEVERRTLLYRYTEEWPEVQRFAKEIEALRNRTIPALLERIRSQLAAQLSAVNQQVASQAAELRQIPTRTIETARRQREAALHAQLYNDLKVRLNNAKLAEATAGLADMQIVDEAVPPRGPDRDPGPRIFLLTSIAGLGIGIAGVLMRDKLDHRIRNPKQVTETLGLPLLGVVPQLNGKKNAAGLRVAIAIEAFRGIRTQLARAGGSEGKLTMVTSPAPREGKSMIAANLAISYAAAGYQTVLVDGDTRRGRAQEMFGLATAPGLTDYLMERASVEDVLQKPDVKGLELLARGSLKDFNVDRLDSERMDELLDFLRESYEAVIIDAPPLAAGADALLLGERADKVILVVRAGTTDEVLARTKLDMIGNVELHIVGTVLNAVPASAPYYDHYVNYYYAEAEAVS